MRTIKFRAWDGKKYWSPVAVYDGEPLVWNYEETNLVPLLTSDQKNLLGMKTVLEQFTGLHDKNGREIYEGDVLRNHNGDIQRVVWGPRIQAILIRRAGDRWPAQYLDCEYMGWEVIGNIHENPELLKDPT